MVRFEIVIRRDGDVVRRQLRRPMAIRQPKIELLTKFNELSTQFNELSTNSSMNSTNYRRRRDAEGVRPRSGPTTKSSDAEGVRPRSGPTTKWSGSKSLYGDVVMSSDADSFEIEFLRLPAFHIAFFLSNFDPKTLSKPRFRTDDFVVGRLRRRTTSWSDDFVVGRLRR